MNREALPFLAEQIRLRNLSGGIVVDLAGLSPRKRAGLAANFIAALAIDPLHPRFLGFTALGAEAKRRSIQNSYLTLPVVLAMIATHFPSGYGSRWSWEILLALMALGAFVRHFFIQWHAGRRLYAIPAAAAAAFVGLLVAVSPARAPAGRMPVRWRNPIRGTVGPNLDAAKPSRDLVIDRVTNGLGTMPSFRNRLSTAQIAAIALFVSSAAGRR